ncbi:hypothetical protein HDU76_006926 [Blyttiomyces sp. JEL0837]|nr:hypothetical protein HDU76_006926 [Blyttiomyces sp. JEL0837]
MDANFANERRLPPPTLSDLNRTLDIKDKSTCLAFITTIDPPRLFTSRKPAYSTTNSSSPNHLATLRIIDDSTKHNTSTSTIVQFWTNKVTSLDALTRLISSLQPGDLAFFPNLQLQSRAHDTNEVRFTCIQSELYIISRISSRMEISNSLRMDCDEWDLDRNWRRRVALEIMMGRVEELMRWSTTDGLIQSFRVLDSAVGSGRVVPAGKDVGGNIDGVGGVGNNGDANGRIETVEKEIRATFVDVLVTESSLRINDRDGDGVDEARPMSVSVVLKESGSLVDSVYEADESVLADLLDPSLLVHLSLQRKDLWSNDQAGRKLRDMYRLRQRLELLKSISQRFQVRVTKTFDSHGFVVSGESKLLEVCGRQGDGNE